MPLLTLVMVTDSQLRAVVAAARSGVLVVFHDLEKYVGSS